MFDLEFYRKLLRSFRGMMNWAHNQKPTIFNENSVAKMGINKLKNKHRYFYCEYYDIDFELACSGSYYIEDWIDYFEIKIV